MLVLMAGETNRSILFCREKDPEREVWDGFRYGPDGARITFGLDEAYSLSQLDELMPQFISISARSTATWY